MSNFDYRLVFHQSDKEVYKLFLFSYKVIVKDETFCFGGKLKDRDPASLEFSLNRHELAIEAYYFSML